MEAPGIETKEGAPSAPLAENAQSSIPGTADHTEAKSAKDGPHRPLESNSAERLAELDCAVLRAVEAGRWELAEMLATELRARRDARAGVVVNLETERARRAAR